MGLPKSYDESKVDLRRAYDTITWELTDQLRLGYGFPPQFCTKSHDLCISIAKISVKFNGESFWYFASKRGLRQGGPMSTLIFVMVMEYLNRTLRVACYVSYSITQDVGSGVFEFVYAELCG